MADTNFRGPLNSMGSLEVQAGNTATIEPLDGPSLFYQASGFPDLRTTFPKDGMLPARALGFLQTDVVTVDGVPQATGTALLAAAQVLTAGTAMALATVGVLGGTAAGASIAVGVPFLPPGTTVVTTVIALDFGFTTGTTTTNSSTVVVVDNTLFEVGQWIIVGNVGNGAATRSLIAQVQSVATANTTGITISPVAATGLANVPIGQANLYGSGLLPPATQFGPAAASASAVAIAGAQDGGFARIMNPKEMLARSLSFGTATTAGTTSVVVSGYDIWGQPLTERISISPAASAALGAKAFKYILNAVPSTTSATTYTLGIGGLFGFPFRLDEPEQALIRFGGTTNPTAAVLSSTVIATAAPAAATQTTGDVRGTVSATAYAAGGPDGVRRLHIVQFINPMSMIAATPNNLTPTYGTTQV